MFIPQPLCDFFCFIPPTSQVGILRYLKWPIELWVVLVPDEPLWAIVMLISTKLKSKHTPSNDGAHDEHGSSLTFPNHHGACSQDCWQGSKTQITTSNETLLQNPWRLNSSSVQFSIPVSTCHLWCPSAC